MNPMLRFCQLGAGVMALLAGIVAQAAPTTYTGVDPTTNGSIPAASVAAAQRASFLGALSNSASEGFESFAVGATAPLTLSSIGAQLTGSGSVQDTSVDPFTGEFLGRFNTTAGGTKWWETTGTFSLLFTNAISAFGFYATDIGDFNGVLSLIFDDDAAHAVTLDTNGVIGNASLLFWGVADNSGATFKKVTIQLTQLDANGLPITDPDAYDHVGFDDIVAGIASRGPTTVPEPGSLLLVALSLAGALAATRRRSA